jgi:hypothetical protein
VPPAEVAERHGDDGAAGVGRREAVGGERDEDRLAPGLGLEPGELVRGDERQRRRRRGLGVEALEPLALRGRGVVRVLVAVPAPVPQLAPRLVGEQRPGERPLERVEHDDRGGPAREPAEQASRLPGGQECARCSGTRANAPNGSAPGSTATTPGARSRSSACSRRMNRSSERGRSRTAIGAAAATGGEAIRAPPPPPVAWAPVMAALLKRLVAGGAAYQAAAVLSAAVALVTLPLYTRALSEADYGRAETLLVTIILASIVLRLGLGEALVRFSFERDPVAVARTVTGTVLVTTTVAAAFACSSPVRCPRRCSGPATPSCSGSASSGCGRSRTSRWRTRCCASRSAGRRTCGRP